MLILYLHVISNSTDIPVVLFYRIVACTPVAR
jgi:hypothetical protein